MLSPNSFRCKNILILGYGKSGQSAEKLLANITNQIFVFDPKLKTKTQKNNKILKNNYFFNKNDLFLKKFAILNNQSIFIDDIKKLFKTHKIHFCILSPGISIHNKIVKIIKMQGIKILSELDLGFIFARGKILAITGTNGKTTTAHALHHILSTAGKESFLCGNVGTPLSEIVPKTTSKSFLVVECSSFQLQTSKYFKPFVASILNLEADHLDHHKSMTEYTLSKAKIFSSYKTIKLFNYDNPSTKQLAKKFDNAKFYSIKNKKIYKNKLNLIKNNNLIGNFNNSNLMCATEMALFAGVGHRKIKLAIKSFFPPFHRLEKIGSANKITFINDSKSTNVASTLSALSVMPLKTIVLLGGAEKNLDYAPLLSQNFYACIAYGEIGNKLHNLFKGHKEALLATNLENAFNLAVSLAESLKEDCVLLLSPATSSFDEFSGYEQRGEFFKKLSLEYIENHK